ncbi:MAG: flagellar hook-length control protein FliK [Pseudomonadota bacterium]
MSAILDTLTSLLPGGKTSALDRPPELPSAPFDRYLQDDAPPPTPPKASARARGQEESRPVETSRRDPAAQNVTSSPATGRPEDSNGSQDSSPRAGHEQDSLEKVSASQDRTSHEHDKTTGDSQERSNAASSGDSQEQEQKQQEQTAHEDNKQKAEKQAYKVNEGQDADNAVPQDKAAPEEAKQNEPLQNAAPQDEVLTERQDAGLALMQTTQLSQAAQPMRISKQDLRQVLAQAADAEQTPQGYLRFINDKLGTSFTLEEATAFIKKKLGEDESSPEVVVDTPQVAFAKSQATLQTGAQVDGSDEQTKDAVADSKTRVEGDDPNLDGKEDSAHPQENRKDKEGGSANGLAHGSVGGASAAPMARGIAGVAGHVASGHDSSASLTAMQSKPMNVSSPVADDPSQPVQMADLTMDMADPLLPSKAGLQVRKEQSQELSKKWKHEAAQAQEGKKNRIAEKGIDGKAEGRIEHQQPAPLQTKSEVASRWRMRDGDGTSLRQGAVGESASSPQNPPSASQNAQHQGSSIINRAAPSYKPVFPGVIGEQIAARIRQARVDGQHRFIIRMQPQELGTVEVELDLNAERGYTARISVARPETLEFLQKDSAYLERALAEMGLKAEGGGLEFSLRQQNQDRADTSSKASFQNNEQTSNQEEIENTIEETSSEQVWIVRPDRVDIHV